MLVTVAKGGNDPNVHPTDKSVAAHPCSGMLLSVQRNEVVTCYNVDDLENVMLCGKSQSQNTVYCMIPCM